MEKRLDHYSNKGGHLQRGLINKIKRTIEKDGILINKGDLSYCARRFAKRIPADGKR